MSQLVTEIKRRIPWINIRSLLMWETILNVYPMGQQKINLINKANFDGVIVGIMTDHLMKVARKVGVPRSYIKNLSLTRIEYKRYKNDKRIYESFIEESKNNVLLQTRLLLEAINVKIKENKSLLEKIRDKK